eukprot:scaffold30513_cov123-Isochrysis_galbana.AAC.1
MVGFDPSRQLHWVESRVDLRGSSAKEVDKTGLRVIPYNPLWDKDTDSFPTPSNAACGDALARPEARPEDWMAAAPYAGQFCADPLVDSSEILQNWTAILRFVENSTEILRNGHDYMTSY